jgi:hypothetical protein
MSTACACVDRTLTDGRAGGGCVDGALVDWTCAALSYSLPSGGGAAGAESTGCRASAAAQDTGGGRVYQRGAAAGASAHPTLQTNSTTSVWAKLGGSIQRECARV